jgi:hypothetical protein
MRCKVVGREKQIKIEIEGLRSRAIRYRLRIHPHRGLNLACEGGAKSSADAGWQTNQVLRFRSLSSYARQWQNETACPKACSIRACALRFREVRLKTGTSMMATFFARPKKVAGKKRRRSRNAQALVVLAESAWNLGLAGWKADWETAEIPKRCLFCQRSIRYRLRIHPHLDLNLVCGGGAKSSADAGWQTNQGLRFRSLSPIGLPSKNETACPLACTTIACGLRFRRDFLWLLSLVTKKVTTTRRNVRHACGPRFRKVRFRLNLASSTKPSSLSESGSRRFVAGTTLVTTKVTTSAKDGVRYDDEERFLPGIAEICQKTEEEPVNGFHSEFWRCASQYLQLFPEKQHLEVKLGVRPEEREAKQEE